MTRDEQEDQETQTLIDELRQKLGIDFSAGKDELKSLVHSQGDGNWDNSTDFDPSLNLRDIRVIQEDEYDQSMDEDDDRPEEPLFFGSLGYVFFA